MKVGVKLIQPDAMMPTQKMGDIGWDLYAIEDINLSLGINRVATGIALAQWDDGLVQGPGSSIFVKIEGRSSMSARGVFPIGGIIDSSYRGEIFATMVSLSHEPVPIKKGERFAQLVFYRAMGLDCGFTLEQTDQVDETARGAGGFGSTGR